jgi:PAB-dependent poly(A)-specific ribonuclease subunit 3
MVPQIVIEMHHGEARFAEQSSSRTLSPSLDSLPVCPSLSGSMSKDQTNYGSENNRHEADLSSTLNLEDRSDFPSLSTAAQFFTLPKRKQAQRRALNSFHLSEPVEGCAGDASLLPEGPITAKNWPKIPELLKIPTAPTTETRVRPARQIADGRAEAACSIQLLSRPLENPGSTDSMLQASLFTKSEAADHFTNGYGSAKKQLNVDSPSFTPAQLPGGNKKSTFSSQTVNAAPFTPKGVANGKSSRAHGFRVLSHAHWNVAAAPVISQDGDTTFLNPAVVREFTPQTQNYDLNTAAATNGIGGDSSGGLYDAYAMAGMNQALPASQYNPYAEDHNSIAAAGASYYPTQGVYTAPMQPLQYHLYAPVGPPRSDLAPYQRQAHDFFISNDLREDLQKKSAATRQVMHNSQLPDVQPYHSLVPLEGIKSGQSSLFGNTVCWVYKATSKKNGHVYCLRRLQGARVSGKESTNTPLTKWKRIINGSIVTPVEVFTSRDFNDTSLIFIHNYHPSSKTLAEHHLGGGRFRPSIQEGLLWTYISQLCNALRAIHSGELAARCIHPTKVIITEKNRIRLSACMILDVLEYDTPRPLADLQHEDLVDLGKLVLSLCLNQVQIHNVQASCQSFQQTTYSPELKDLVLWLVTAPPSEQKNIGYLSQSIAHHLFDSFDASLHAYDDLTSEIHKELENGRIARLLLKLGTINERPEFDNDPNWAENGERYTLKLFRDYVFHQVDANNNPVLNLGHMLSCLNKLDAGIEEKVYLTSRDHQTSFVVSYKELKKQATNAFQELQKAGQAKPAASRSVF